MSMSLKYYLNYSGLIERLGFSLEPVPRLTPQSFLLIIPWYHIHIHTEGPSLKNLAGTFRVSHRELNVICHLRYARMSINHIAEILGRSTRTVFKYVEPMNIDNRRTTPLARSLGVRNFQSKRLETRMRVRLFLEGITADLIETFSDSSFIIRIIMALCKNFTLDNTEEPP